MASTSLFRSIARAPSVIRSCRPVAASRAAAFRPAVIASSNFSTTVARRNEAPEDETFEEFSVR